MAKQICEWAGCDGVAEAALEKRVLCRDHFYEIANRRVEMRLERIAPAGKDRTALLQFLSELISETTTPGSQKRNSWRPCSGTSF